MNEPQCSVCGRAIATQDQLRETLARAATFEVAASKQMQDATKAICRLGESLVRAEKRAALGARMVWCLKQRAGGLTCEELAALAEWDALAESKEEAKA